MDELPGYDNWKTTDRQAERAQEQYEEVSSAIERYGCPECGNDDPDKFEDIEYGEWEEKCRGRRYRCDKMEATCKKCGALFTHGHEPDWDSMPGGADYVD